MTRTPGVILGFRKLWSFIDQRDPESGCVR